MNGEGQIVQVLVENGELVAPADMNIRIVTLGFQASGGDGYPFADSATDVVDLTDVLTDGGASDFAAPGSEQDALAEYLLENFSEQSYSAAETDASDDTRIQNFSEHEGTVLQGQATIPVDAVDGGGDSVLTGAAGADRINGGAGDDLIDGLTGDDHLLGGYGDDKLYGRERQDLLDGDSGNDWLYGGAGADKLHGGNNQDYLFGEHGNDELDSKGNDYLAGGEGNDQLKLRSYE